MATQQAEVEAARREFVTAQEELQTTLDLQPWGSLATTPAPPPPPPTLQCHPHTNIGDSCKPDLQVCALPWVCTVPKSVHRLENYFNFSRGTR